MSRGNSAAEQLKCYVCSSGRFVDEHHVDKNFGRISIETVPMCRRCHRTLHDLGIEWFDDLLLDRALEIENKYLALKGRRLLTRDDSTRSDYYLKVHNLNKKRLSKPVMATGWPQLSFPGFAKPETRTESLA